MGKRNNDSNTKTYKFSKESSARDFAEKTGSTAKEENGKYNVTVTTSKETNQNINQENTEKSIRTGDFNTYGYSDDYWDD